jgi:hypothetical protein
MIENLESPHFREDKERYAFVYVGVINGRGDPSTVCVAVADYDQMLHLARGSSPRPDERVRDVLRKAARTLYEDGYRGRWSPRVRERAVAMLRGSFVPAFADEYDRAQFPDGRPLEG